MSSGRVFALMFGVFLVIAGLAFIGRVRKLRRDARQEATGTVASNVTVAAFVVSAVLAIVCSSTGVTLVYFGLTGR